MVEYSWDHRNRLTGITSKDNVGTVTHQVDYTYDIFNRRIVKTIDADGAGSGTATKEIYIHEGLREERDGAGDQILLAFDESGGLTERYLHGPAVDQVLASEDVTSPATAGDVLWALSDNLGSVRDIAEYDAGTDTTTVVNHITYDAFGNITAETNSSVDFLFAYTGRERDVESDLQYNRARYYDAAIGRWLSQDPIGFEAGDANLYRYVGNGPTGATDASGESRIGFLDQVRGQVNGLVDFFRELRSNRHNIDPRVFELGLDVVQLGIDVVGIFEPTPFADGTNTAISLCRRDWWGAGFSLMGIVPYVGDLGKVGKLPKYARSVSNAIDLIKRSPPEVGRLLRPALENVNRILQAAESFPLSSLPTTCGIRSNAEAALAQLRAMRQQLDEFLTPNGALPIADDGLNFLRNGGCFIPGTPVRVSAELASVSTNGRAEATTMTADATPQTTTAAIQNVALGARVPDQNPRPEDYDFSFGDVDQGTWRQVDIRLRRKGGALIEMQLLRPAEWIESMGLVAGAEFTPHLSDIEVDGHANVTAISPCPQITEGEGSVVTGRFVTRQVNNLVEVTLENGTTFTGTTTHPVWVPNDQQWIKLGDLEEGQQLESLSGPITVVAISRLAHVSDVFNIEVHGHHVYRITEYGVLVHNNCFEEAIARGMRVIRGPGAPDRMVEIMQNLGRSMSRIEIGEVIHRVKDKARPKIGAADDLIFDHSGGLWHPHTGEFLGKIWEW